MGPAGTPPQQQWQAPYPGGQSGQPAYMNNQNAYSPPPQNRNGKRIGLAVAAVVAVGAAVTFGIVQLTGSGDSSTPPTPSPSTPTSSPVPPTTAPSTPDSTNQNATASNVGVSKAGCAQAASDLDAFNASSPSTHGGKDFQIKADRDLATKLGNDAQLATDPDVKAAIQTEADTWNQFADYYAAGDAVGMGDTITKTKNAIAAVQDICRS